MSKNTIIVILLIVLVGLGYLFFLDDGKTEEKIKAFDAQIGKLDIAITSLRTEREQVKKELADTAIILKSYQEKSEKYLKERTEIENKYVALKRKYNQYTDKEIDKELPVVYGRNGVAFDVISESNTLVIDQKNRRNLLTFAITSEQLAEESKNFKVSFALKDKEIQFLNTVINLKNLEIQNVDTENKLINGKYILSENKNDLYKKEVKKQKIEKYIAYGVALVFMILGIAN